MQNDTNQDKSHQHVRVTCISSHQLQPIADAGDGIHDGDSHTGANDDTAVHESGLLYRCDILLVNI